jgi:hypothetical protein
MINWIRPYLLKHKYLSNKERNYMNRTIITVVLAAELFLTQLAPAQGTLYMSDLGLTPTGSLSIGSDSWIALNFSTGDNAGGYALNSIQLPMDAASGSPSGFAVSIFSTSGSSPYSPDNNLGNMSGSTTPSAGGLFTYTASDITLLPSTSYYILVTAATPIAQGAFEWSAVPGESGGSGNWNIAGYFNSSNNGQSWQFSRRYDGQLAMYITDVPEPEIYVLAGLGLAALGFWRRKR